MNLAEMAKMAQQMQSKMMKIQAELANELVEATSGGGVVKVVMNGQQQIKEVTISPEVVDPEDVEMLQDLILAAVSEALDKSRELAAQRMGAVTGGMNLPGLF